MTSEASVFSALAQWFPSGKTSARSNAARVGKLSAQLELFLPFRWPDSEHPVRWSVRSGSSIERQGVNAKLEDLDAELRSLPLTVILDPFDTAILQASLPTMSRKNLVRALPYTFEEHVLGDVEQQFFTLMKSSSESTTVCVIAHERMQAILEALSTADLSPTIMLPAISATPLLENTWTLVFTGENGQDELTVWFRTGLYSGTACTIEDKRPPYALKKSLSAANQGDTAPTALLIINAPSDLDAKAWADELGLEILQPESGFWENLNQGETEFNLLQGQYKPKLAVPNSSRRLRLAISLLLVLLAGNLGVFGFDWYQLYKESRAINSEMIALFKKSFPDQANAVFDPVQQMQKNLDRLRQEKGGAQVTDFLALLSPVSKAMAQNSDINKIRYSDKSIIVEIHLADYRNLDQLKKTFSDNRLSVQVMQAESDANGVQATLKLQVRQGSAS